MYVDLSSRCAGLQKRGSCKSLRSRRHKEVGDKFADLAQTAFVASVAQIEQKQCEGTKSTVGLRADTSVLGRLDIRATRTGAESFKF